MLLKEIARVAAICLALLTFVLVVGNIMTRFFHLLVSSEIPAWYILEIFALLIPFSLIFTLPWSLLTGILLAMGRMSADSELVAVRAAGISLAWLTAPVLILAILLSVLSLLISTVVAPWCDARLRFMAFVLAERSPSALFEPRQVISVFPGLRIWLEEKQGPYLYNVHVWELDERDNIIRSLRARRAQIEADGTGEGILLTLWQARVDERDRDDPRDVTRVRVGTRFEEAPVRIPLAPLRRQVEERRGLSSLRLDQLMERIWQGRTAIEDFNFYPTLTEIQKRVAAALGPLTLALIGIPLGVRSHRKETWAGIALSVAIAFCYYFLLVFAETFKERGAFFPELLIWLPNILFQVLGMWLFWRIAQK
jgi:lipopolysaccharide export system permease protein